MYFRVYQDARSKWRWALFATNHKKIAVSADGHQSMEDIGRGIGLVMSADSSTCVVEKQNQSDTDLPLHDTEDVHT